MFRAFFIALSKSQKLKNFFLKNKAMNKLSKRFVAGQTLEDTLFAVQRLNSLGMTVTMDFLGEHVTEVEKAQKACEEICSIYDFIEKHKIQGNVSIKLTQMGLSVDEELCYKHVEKILKQVEKYDSFLRIDMEDSSLTDQTLNLFYHFRKKTPRVGIVLQAYLYRTPKDMEKVLALEGSIRLCKGAYKEPPTISYPKKKQVDEAYITLMKKLLESPVYHALATHDEKILQMAQNFARSIKKDPKSFEFQMLFGIQRERQKSIVQEGYRMRVYVPYGREWYPYFMRRIAERPANAFFILRNLFRR